MPIDDGPFSYPRHGIGSIVPMTITHFPNSIPWTEKPTAKSLCNHCYCIENYKPAMSTKSHDKCCKCGDWILVVQGG